MSETLGRPQATGPKEFVIHRYLIVNAGALLRNQR
jgi:hypothetical protein